MRVLLLLGGSLELRRQGFQHRPVIRLESLVQFFLSRSVTSPDQLHDRDRRHSGCGDELDHDLGFANVGLLDIKTGGLECAEELLDGPTLAIKSTIRRACFGLLTACVVRSRQWMGSPSR